MQECLAEVYQQKSVEGIIKVERSATITIQHQNFANLN